MAKGDPCSIPGCGKPQRARLLCPVHYEKFLKHGDPLWVPPKYISPIHSEEKLKMLRAHRQINKRVADGRIVKPKDCEICGLTAKALSDGRSGLIAHHHDYDKPLDVTWICVTCHRREHPNPKVQVECNKGKNAGQRTLTEQDIRDIRSSQFGCHVLSRIYGMSKSHMMRIRNGRAYSTVS